VEASAIDSNDTAASNVMPSSKALDSSTSPIKKVYTSKSTFKAGTTVKIKVATTKSVKSVSVSIVGKSKYNHRLKKSGTGLWYCNLETKGLKTGKYKLNVKAVVSKKKTYKKHVYLTVDNVAPKIRSIKSNSTKITAGTPFYIEAIADKSSKKVLVKVRGKTILFKASPMAVNKKSFNSSNSNNWTLNAKISYKEIGTLTINVYVYDSLGNYVKKTLYIKSSPRYVYWNGTLLKNSPVKAHYHNPINDYQRAINLLSNYVNVYEGYAGGIHTLGVTHHNGYKVTRVVIAYKDPFVVYHEMAHVLNWRWSEYQCDVYAYEKVGYWVL